MFFKIAANHGPIRMAEIRFIELEQRLVTPLDFERTHQDFI